MVLSISSIAGTGHELTLNATKKHPAAKGTALINDNNMSIQARGLKPDSFYTVWFVNIKPKKHEPFRKFGMTHVYKIVSCHYHGQQKPEGTFK